MMERASLAAIKRIDEEADKQPEDKTDPRFKGKPQHQPATASDGDSRRDRTKRNSKGAGPLGLGAPQDENPYGNDHERKQSSDIRQVGEGVDIPKAGRDADRKSGNPSADMRCLISLVNAAENAGQQTVA